jgi:S-adenosylmethionine decarboxylase
MREIDCEAGQVLSRMRNATVSSPESNTGGCEWVVEAHGCDSTSLCDVARLQAVFARIIDECSLHPVSEPVWHKFPGAGGVTGLALLSESHLACHTFPEYGSACINLFCCRPRPEWDYESRLREMLGATSVIVRRIDRPYGRAV